MGLFDKNKEKDEDLKRRNPDNLPTKFQVIIRMVVGVYLCYLVYKLIKDGALVRTQGVEKIIMIAAVVLFTAAGVFFFIKGFKAFRSRQYFDPNSDDFSEEGQAEAEARKAEEEAAEPGAEIPAPDEAESPAHEEVPEADGDEEKKPEE